MCSKQRIFSFYLDVIVGGNLERIRGGQTKIKQQGMKYSI